jgi:hypothetical protein
MNWAKGGIVFFFAVMIAIGLPPLGFFWQTETTRAFCVAALGGRQGSLTRCDQ